MKQVRVKFFELFYIWNMKKFENLLNIWYQNKGYTNDDDLKSIWTIQSCLKYIIQTNSFDIMLILLIFKQNGFQAKTTHGQTKFGQAMKKEEIMADAYIFEMSTIMADGSNIWPMKLLVFDVSTTQ